LAQGEESRQSGSEADHGIAFMNSSKTDPTSPSIHIVFDSNKLYTRELFELLPAELKRFVKSLNTKTSVNVSLYLPWVAKAERQFQMMSAARAILPDVNKVERLLGASFNVTEEKLDARIEDIISGQLREYGIEIIELDSANVKWQELIKQAVFRTHPFQKGDTEKGFRDAIVLESFCQLHQRLQLSPPNRIVLVSRDALLCEAATKRLEGRHEVSIVDTVNEVGTILSAAMAHLDQAKAERIVERAHERFLRKFSLSDLTGTIMEKYKAVLDVGPPDGGVVTVLIGLAKVNKSNLLDKTDSKLTFSTPITIPAEASRRFPPVTLPLEANTVSNAIISSFGDGLWASTFSFPAANPGVAYLIPSERISMESNVTRTVKLGWHTFNVIWSTTLASDETIGDPHIERIDHDPPVWG
jgi:hypothetical protein